MRVASLFVGFRWRSTLTDEEIWKAEERRGDHNPGCTVTMHPIGCLILIAAAMFGLMWLFHLLRGL
ncbi:MULTISPECIES: hypothetical protein [unclassified Sphingobium]|uniref:hypothetical protein n=1 Tax=unclassified Sphingobium TaxID=2611147 RepID=UPI0035A61796